MKAKFDEINAQTLEGRLPNIPIRPMQRGSRMWGYFRWRGAYRRTLSPKDLMITINFDLGFDLEHLYSTLRHEMAHALEFLLHGSSTDGSERFACFCALLQAEDTIYKGRHAAHRSTR